MTDDPASWPDWTRHATEFPRVGVTVLVVVRDATGSAWVDFGERLPGGQWRTGDQIAMESDVVEVVAWMPVPPPAAVHAADRPAALCWCGTAGCLMPGEHLESECHTLEMVTAVGEADALRRRTKRLILKLRRLRETVKAKSYPTKEVKNQTSDPKGKT